MRAQCGGNNNHHITNRDQAANERCGGHLCLLPYIYFEAPDASLYSGKLSHGEV